MSYSYLKKSLGQHFLRDENMLKKIAAAIGRLDDYATVVEIGPGKGALTKHLLAQNPNHLYVVELDDRWAAYLDETYPMLKGKILHEDFLKADLGFMKNPTHLVGNFPYNISSQIVFKVIENKELIEQMTGMFQKEVAQRIAAAPGSKEYGVISVVAQAYYECVYLFDVPPGCFEPPPKVMSGVIQLHRKKNESLDCDEKLFRNLVKKAFNQRRKTLRNSLKGIVSNKEIFQHEVFNLRPEQLSVAQFVELTNLCKFSNE